MGIGGIFVVGVVEVDCSAIRRGDIVFADLSPVIGSEQGGSRPLVVIQNNIGNRHSPTLIVASITAVGKKKMVTHVELKAAKYKFIKRDSVVLLEQLRTIDKDRISDMKGSVNEEDMKLIDKALAVSIGLLPKG